MKFTALLVLICSAMILSCSGGGESGAVEIVLPKNPLPLIPAPGISCLSRKNAGLGAPSQDIGASYFRIPTITFNRKESTKTLIISLMRLKIKIPGGSETSCDFGGDALASLAADWWSNSTKEATIPVGSVSFSTDCALYCGGINTERTYVGTGLVEIFGLERDETTLEETPVKAEGSFSVQSF